MTARIGSLFSGAGGLDMAVESVLDARTVWHAEIDPAASRVLAHNFPDVPNLGDVTAVDWSTVEPVDVLTGGFPCQDLSLAGKRAGLREGTRSGLWNVMADAIDALRPALVVIENVRGLLSAEAHSDVEPCPWCVGDGAGSGLRALGAILGDLADLGYDARWCGLRAADVGAPHGRFRVFIVAAANTEHAERPRVGEAAGSPLGHDRSPVSAFDTAGEGLQGQAGGRVQRGVPGAGHRGPRARCCHNGCSGIHPVAFCDGRHHCTATDADVTGLQGTEPARGRHLSDRSATTDAECGGRDGRTPDTQRGPLGRTAAAGSGEADRVRWGQYEPAIREGELGGDDPETSGGTLLGQGEQDRDVLAVDGLLREQVGAREVHGSREELEGASLGLRSAGGADSGGVDAGSPVQGAGVREPVAPRAGDACRERASAGRGSDALPAGASVERFESVRRSEVGASQVQDVPGSCGSAAQGETNWGPYRAAIERWERLTRPAPAPTDLAPKGGQRLSPAFTEWLMGWPDGWVTNVPGVTRNDALRICGNGVVPQQAAEALRWMLGVCEVAA